MKFVIILLSIFSINLLALNFNSIDIEVKFKIRNELSKKIKNFRIKKYRLPNLKKIKSIKQIKKIEFLGDNLLGSTAFVLKTNKKKFFGSIIISQRVRYLYAKRNIKRNESVTKDDFEEVEIYETNKDYKTIIKSYKEIKGKIAKVNIKAYKKIYQYQFDTPYIINKGDDVVIRAKQGHLIISMKGIAKQRGKLGKYIMVKTSFNNKILRTKVIAPQRVSFFIGD